MLSPAAEREFREFSGSESFRNDMDALRRGHLHAFVVDGTVDIDAFLTFVAEFNDFIGHEPKPFKPFTDKCMKL